MLDRSMHSDTSLTDGAKLALISMDSTLRSNLSVAMPLDLLPHHNDSVDSFETPWVKKNDAHFRLIRERWSVALSYSLRQIPSPGWLPDQSLSDLEHGSATMSRRSKRLQHRPIDALMACCPAGTNLCPLPIDVSLKGHIRASPFRHGQFNLCGSHHCITPSGQRPWRIPAPPDIARLPTTGVSSAKSAPSACCLPPSARSSAWAGFSARSVQRSLPDRHRSSPGPSAA
jgi:hypothetical protein